MAVSLHERYSITRANLGFSHYVSILVAYPSPSTLPHNAVLSKRIAELQEHFPLLSSSVLGRKTREPYFQQRESPWTPEDILHTATYDTTIGDAREHVLKAENDRVAATDIDTAPLWHIGLYTASTTGEDKPAYLVLSVNHVLSDGKGAFILLDALLCPDISELPYEQVDKIKRLDDTMNIKPGAMFILGVIWAELIVPRLPTFLQPYLASPPAWPAQTFSKPAFECPSEFAITDFPSDLIDALRKAGKAHSVPTLHPILKLSLATALWAVKKDTLDPFQMDLQTPGSVRRPELGHGYLTANYVSSITIPFSPTPSTPFWDETAKSAKYMSSPAGKQQALGSMGTLGYVPDPTPDPSKRDTNKPTGWEEFFFNKGYSNNRFPASLGISNIGKVDLPPNAIDLVWAQSAWPGAPPYEVNVVGHSAGLRAAPIWREGAAVTRADWLEIEKIWTRVLERLADPSNSAITLGELVKP